MDGIRKLVHRLRKDLESADAKVDALEIQLAEAKAKAACHPPIQSNTTTSTSISRANVRVDNASSNGESSWPLQPDEYTRYGRQLIIPEVGLEGWHVPLSCV